MPSENNKILEVNQYQKSDKAPIYYLYRYWMRNRTYG